MLVAERVQRLVVFHCSDELVDARHNFLGAAVAGFILVVDSGGFTAVYRRFRFGATFVCNIRRYLHSKLGELCSPRLRVKLRSKHGKLPVAPGRTHFDVANVVEKRLNRLFREFGVINHDVCSDATRKILSEFG